MTTLYRQALRQPRADHALFSDMLLSASEKRIVLVHALGGMGKSWLVAKQARCSIQSPPVPIPSISKTGKPTTTSKSAVSVTTLGHTSITSQTINAGTDIALICRLRSGTGAINFTQSEVGVGSDVAGRDIIKDKNSLTCKWIVKRCAVDEARITEAFFSDLRSLLGKTTSVFFVDTYEKAPEATRRWIENHLLYQIREGRLPRAAVIITGREVPQFDLAWKHCTSRPKLEALSNEHVATYLRDKRGLTDVDADTLYRATQGNPQLLGILADNLAAKSDADEEW